MKSTQALYRIIHSLTSAEKKAFRIQSDRQKGDKRYLDYFDFLLAMEELDNSKAKSFFAHKEQSHVLEDYLFRSILRSIRLTPQNEKHELQLLLLDIHQLYQRDLLKKMKRYIDKGKKIAEQQELYEMALQLCTYELNYWMAQSVKEYKDKLPIIYEKQKQLMALIQNRATYEQLYIEILTFAQKNWVARDEESQKALQTFIAQKELRELTLAQSFHAKVNFIRTQIIYCRLAEKHIVFHKWNKRFIHLFNQRPIFKKTCQAIYVDALIKYMYSGLIIRSPQVIEEAQQYLADIRHLSMNNQKRIFTYASPNIIQYYFLMKKDFVAGEKYLEKLQQQFPKFKRQLTPQALCMYYMNLKLKYMELKKYEKAQHFSQKLMDLKVEKVRKDAAGMFYVQYCILQYERKTWKHLASVAPNLLRTLNRHKKALKTEQVLLKFFKNAAQKKQLQQAITPLLEKLKQSLEKLLVDPFEKSYIYSFNFLDWLEKKREEEKLT